MINNNKIFKHLCENTSCITPVQAQKILADNGMQVSIEQAEEILKFLTTLAEITLNNEELLALRRI
jgi:hypothetical protein